MTFETRMTGRDPRTGRTVEIAVRNGLIVSVNEITSDDPAWLSPGLVDLQVNGYLGFDINADALTHEIVAQVARSMLATGVTAFLPTIITASEEKIVANLRVIAEARKSDALLATMIPGVHIEGPHIAAEDGPRGAHPREHVRPPSIDEFDRWQKASGGLVRLVTLSPHWDEAPAYIAALRERNVLVSIGHTNAAPDQIRAAVDAGASLSTHLGNGVSSMLPRHPNLLWTQLAEDRLTAMFIADGHHLPADTLKAMLRAKGLQRTILVSDMAALGGMPPGLYDSPIGGRVEVTPEGRLNMAGTGLLAGSSVPLKDAVAYVAQTGVPLPEALHMATEAPANLLGLTAKLEVGAPANLIRFHWQPSTGIELQSVWLRGEQIN